MPIPAIAENRYWLQTMGDHAMIILDALSPNETEEIKSARGLINDFDGLLEEARREINDDQIKQLNGKAIKAVQDLRTFKLHLMKRQITGRIDMLLSSALLNHMMNELDEYILILDLLSNGKPVIFHPLHLHLVYLLDGIGHSTVIQNYINFPYREIREQAGKFEHDFIILYNKAVEYSGYLRTGLKDFKALNQLNTDIYESMRQFAEFFVGLMLMIREKNVLGPLSVSFLDHMYREECYYLMHLSAGTNSNKPVCDPTSPRMTV